MALRVGCIGLWFKALGLVWDYPSFTARADPDRIWVWRAMACLNGRLVHN